MIGPFGDAEKLNVYDLDLIESLFYKGKADIVQKFVDDIRKQLGGPESKLK